MKKLLALCIVLAGCAAQHPETQSWDQANLKRHDHGCPTAIYVAPGGDLKQCQTEIAPPAALPKETPFDTADAAVLSAFGKIYSMSHWYEYGGVIGKRPDGKFVVFVPDTLRHGTDVNIDEDPEDYNYAIAATYHNHPCIKGAFPSVFSSQDLATARALNRPTYIVDFCTGAVHRWVPGEHYSTALDQLALGFPVPAVMHGVQTAVGTIIGHIVVDGQVIQ